MPDNEPKKRGGPRRGQGRKKDPNAKVASGLNRMAPDVVEILKKQKNRTTFAEEAIRAYAKELNT